MTIGERIKQQRLACRMSQDEVARAIQVTKQAVFKYESGIVTNIPMDKIEKMAQLFRVSPAYLMGWEERKQDVSTERARPTFPIYHVADELWQKISQLDEIDHGKVDAFVSGLLAAEKYQEPTQKLKIAARGGGVKEVTVTDSQLQKLLNLPEVTSLDDLS